MMRWWLSSTSALALMAFGGGRSAAAPMAALADSVVFGTVERTDVVRESLALGAPPPPLIGGIGLPGSGPSARPTIADPGAQTPSATFTYRPTVPVRGDTGPVGSLAANTRRNPGNVSNLRGTIGSDQAGIFAVRTIGVAINAAPAPASDYMFRSVMFADRKLEPAEATDIWPAEPFQDAPSHSVFIGVRSPVGDADQERATREASIISATGSATPTVALGPLPGRPLPAKVLQYQLDAGPATTIGFSTADVRPTGLPAGAAATSSVGYTYTPVGRPNRDPVGPMPMGPMPMGATLSATITAPGGGPARRGWADPIAGLSNADRSFAIVSSASSTVLLARGWAIYPATDSFALARPESGGARLGMDELTIPIVVKGDMRGPAGGGRSLTEYESIEMDDGSDYKRYGLAVSVVLVPLALAFLGFRLVRRAALRYLS